MIVFEPSFFFFFNDTATTEIYTLSLHDALPISVGTRAPGLICGRSTMSTSGGTMLEVDIVDLPQRSEEHTSELQSRGHLVCRLLLEKKKQSALLCPFVLPPQTHQRTS